MADSDGYYGVYFVSEANDLDEEEIRKDFNKYGRIVFVKRILQRVYVNFKTKAAAENCLLDAADPKYGEMRRGKFVTCETQNPARERRNQKINRTDSYTFSKKTDKIEKQQWSSCTTSQTLESESSDRFEKNIEKHSLDGGVIKSEGKSPKCKNMMSNGKNKNDRKSPISPRGSKCQMNSDSQTMAQRQALNKSSMLESKRQRPPPLLSVDMGPPPLQSLDNSLPSLLSGNGSSPLHFDSPPPLVSALEASHHAPGRSSFHGASPLLPTPPRSVLTDLNPEVNHPQFSPQPLSSVDSRPPPLVSAMETNSPAPAKSYNSSNRQALLPTPPSSMQINRNPEFNLSQSLSRLTTQNTTVSSYGSPDVPPPLVSAVSHSKEKRSLNSSNSQVLYEDYVQKYGNYILIANIPDDITTDEVEKILYPHIPIYVSEPEVTNIKMKVLFCLVTFNTPDEATKAAKFLDGVELRGQCLNMIRLDELILFSDTPF